MYGLILFLLWLLGELLPYFDEFTIDMLVYRYSPISVYSIFTISALLSSTIYGRVMGARFQPPSWHPLS